MPASRRTYIAIAVSVLALSPSLSGCADTVVFGAEREIDVAISLNEDVAEPVKVNIGLNSQIGALIPAIGEDDDSEPSAGTGTSSTGLANPEGEAASIFSGFRYTSSSMLKAESPKYDAHIRSQFASGAAAVILADSPEAVNKVVDVAITFDRDPAFMNPATVAWRASLQKRIDGLPEEKVMALYLNPPTTNPNVEALIAGVQGEDQAECAATDLCRRDMLRIRVLDLGTPSDLQTWDSAFGS